MNKLYFKIVLIGIVFLSISCEEKIELDIPDQTPKMVVYGVLMPSEIPVFDLRKSFTIAERNIDKNMQFQQINIADLKLYRNNQLIGSFTPGITDPYSYYLGFSDFKAGEKYVLKGSAPNYPDIYAETQIPNKPDAYIADFYSTMTNTYEYKFSLKINIVDNPDEENYYSLSFASTNSYFPFFYTNYDDINNGHPDPSVTRLGYDLYISDKLFNGKIKTILLDELSYHANILGMKGTEKFMLQCKAITKELYDYKISTYKQGKVEFDFFAEPVLIKHNISGGFGIFGACNSREFQLNIQTK